MKIRKIIPENYANVSALLRQAFSGSMDEVQLVENLRKNGRIIIEWGCVHTKRVIVYIAFTSAYKGKETCGLHLGSLAVNPDFQHRGIGSELLRFALRQNIIVNKILFVLGDPGFYSRFGFEHCSRPLCPFGNSNAHFSSIRNNASSPFIVGYEPEISLAY